MACAGPQMVHHDVFQNDDFHHNAFQSYVLPDNACQSYVFPDDAFLNYVFPDDASRSDVPPDDAFQSDAFHGDVSQNAACHWGASRHSHDARCGDVSYDAVHGGGLYDVNRGDHVHGDTARVFSYSFLKKQRFKNKRT